jgi:hypothetical protein
MFIEDDHVIYDVEDGLAAGLITLSVEVVDPEAASGQDELEIEVLPNEAPVLSWLSPEEGAVVGNHEPLLFSLEGQDAEDSADELLLSWSGLPDGLVPPDRFEPDGELAFSWEEPVIGSWSIELEATDLAGGTAEALLHFEVTESDVDGDGFVNELVGGDDCDDGNAAVHPGGTEVCNDTDDDCNGSIDDGATDADLYYPDEDGDLFGDLGGETLACEQPEGYVTDHEDCDDSDENVKPGASEYCNGYDDDCDGDVDEDEAIDAPTWYADGDGDRYGLDADTRVACEEPPGYAPDSGDCDDSLLSVHPLADELCNGIDDDCLGDIDEADAIDAPTWYRDVDSDSFGSTSPTATQCTLPSGYAATSDDCDDNAVAVFPGADERCNLIDDDCDGSIDEDSAVDVTTWYVDVDLDGYGDPAVSEVDCVQPSGYVSNDRDCDDSTDLASPSEVEVCDDLLDNDCDGSENSCALSGVYSGLQSDGAKLMGESAADESGLFLAGIDDFDGDGFGEVLVGGRGSDIAGTSAGAAWLVDGGPVGLSSLSSADVRFLGESANDELGWTVDSAGDLDGDLYGDLWIAARYNDRGGTNWSATYLFYGGTGISGDVDAGAADAILLGQTGSAEAGSATQWVEDYTGDGLPDVLVGASGTYIGGTSKGAAYLVEGPIYGVQDLGTAALILQGVTTGDELGEEVAAGDLDGDGLSELVVGGDGATTTGLGLAYIVPAGLSGSFVVDAAATALVTGGASADHFASGIRIPGDLDGDGRDDLAIGVRGYNNGSVADTGVVYIWTSLPTSTGTPSSTADIRITGTSSGDRFGSDVESAGDVDGDGVEDLLIGAAGGGALNSGAIYLYRMPLSGTVTASGADARFEPDSATDDCADFIGRGADFDGNGYADVLLGAPGDSTAGTGAGATFVFYGHGL